jgi:hypothetical protein
MFLRSLLRIEEFALVNRLPPELVFDVPVGDVRMTRAEEDMHSFADVRLAGKLGTENTAPDRTLSIRLRVISLAMTTHLSAHR